MQNLEDSSLDAENFNCPLCLKLLCRPTTSMCGHSFCKPCLTASLRHRAKCPICRSVLFSDASTLQVSTDFDRLISLVFKKKYKERLKEVLAASKAADLLGDVALRIPVMVICPILPKQRMELHIYEPKYRILVQRALQGNKKFGLCPSGGFLMRQPLFGTEVEIVDCELLPGGRYYINVVGIRIFRINEYYLQQEYLLCAVSYIHPDKDYFYNDLENRYIEAGMDVSGERFSEPVSEFSQQVAMQLEPLVQEWQHLALNERLAGYPARGMQPVLNRILEELGPIPPVSSPGCRAIWVVSLINPIPSLGLAKDVKIDMMSAMEVDERLAIATSTLKASIEFMKPTRIPAAVIDTVFCLVKKTWMFIVLGAMCNTEMVWWLRKLVLRSIFRR